MKIAFNPKSAAPLNKAPSGDYLNAITFDLAGHNIFARGEMFKGTDTTYLVFRKATQDAVGYNGLVPAPSYTETSIRLLREDGTWIVPKQRPIKLGGSDYIKGTDVDKVLDIHSGNGISIESDDTGKIIINSTLTVDGDFSGTIADAFTQVNIGGNILKAVTNKTLTFVGNGVTLTPNTTTNTILMSVPVMMGATSSESGTAGLVPAPANNQYMCFLRGDGNWVRVEGTSAELVTSTTDGIVPKFDNASGNIDNQASDWVLTSKNGTLGWFKLPMSAFASDWDSITGKPDTFTPSAHKHPTSHIDALTDYSKANSAEALVTTDTLNSALGKLEYKADTVYVWYKSVTGTDNDEIINKWEEIVDFIDSVKEGTDITDEFVTRKTTQTITGAKTFSAATSITNTLTAYDINPATTNTYSLGTSDLRWKNIYATNGNFSSTVSASGFLKANSSDDKVLLGGGGDKAISDFAAASALDNYLPLSGGVLSGHLSLGTPSTTALLLLSVERNSNKLSMLISGANEGWLTHKYNSGKSTALIQNETRGLIFKDTSDNYYDVWHSGNLKNLSDLNNDLYWANINITSSPDSTKIPTLGGLNTTGVIQSSSNYPAYLTSIGTGVYNKTVIMHSTDGLIIERARKTESSSGDIIPLTISQRGGGNAVTFKNNDVLVSGRVESTENYVWESDTKYRVTTYGYQGIGRIYNYNEDTSTYGTLYIGRNSADAIIVKPNGYVGIARDPAYVLDVQSNARVASICLEVADEINRYGGNLYLQHRGTIAGTLGDSRTGNIHMVMNGGTVVIGNMAAQEILNIGGNTLVKGSIRFRWDSPANIGTLYSDTDTNMYNYIHIDRAGGGIRYVSGSWTGGDHIAHSFSTDQDVTRMVIMNATGNVGIGTTNPKSKLSVFAYCSTTPSLGSLGNGGTVEIGASGSYGTYFWTDGSGRGTIQQGRADGTATAYNLAINPLGGYVGIGTNSPIQPLTVNGQERIIASANASSITLDTCALIIGPNTSGHSGYSTGIGFNSLSYGTYINHIHAWIGLGPYTTTATAECYPLIFATNGSTTTNTAPVERMRITPDGNVGIGDSNPAYKLEVAGTICGTAIYANRDGSNTAGGVSLYSNSDPMTYGIAFRGTGTYGTHGYVTAANDWATYLTMNDSTTRGWIFRRGSTNVASIAGNGNMAIGQNLKFSNEAHISTNRSTDYHYGYTFNLTANEQSIGMYSGPAGEAGGVVISPDGCLIYSSSDCGYGLLVRDKDLGSDLTNIATLTFGIELTGQYAWSRGGFKKNGSDDSYVLLGGGGHKLESSLSVNYATSAGSVAWGNVTGKPSTFTPSTHYHNYFPENTAVYFRDPNNASWRGGMYWGSASNEALCFVAVNSNTSFRFFTGSDIANWTSSTWQGTPSFEVNKNGAYAPHFYESSDIRYKTIINNLAIKANQLANLPLFDFKWLDNEDLLNTGTSAQAVQELLPYIVSGTDKLTLDYGVLGTIAGITACKELTEQEKEINELKEQIKFLKDEINNLKTNKLWQS